MGIRFRLARSQLEKPIYLPSGAPVEEFGERALRVVTLADGVPVHNAFPDRDFEEEPA